MSASETTLHLNNAPCSYPLPSSPRKDSGGDVESLKNEYAAASPARSHHSHHVYTQPQPRPEVVDASQPAFPVYHRKFANPAPLGLMATATCCFLVGMINVNSAGVHAPNIAVGAALAYGSIVQLLVGCQEWACGNTFGATVFSSYGAFWLSYAALYIPSFGVVASYSTQSDLEHAMALFSFAWMGVTMIFLLCSLRSSVALVGLFLALSASFACTAVGYLVGSANCARAGGAFDILTAAFSAYTALASLLTKETSFFVLPVGDLSRSAA